MIGSRSLLCDIFEDAATIGVNGPLLGRLELLLPDCGVPGKELDCLDILLGLWDERLELLFLDILDARLPCLSSVVIDMLILECFDCVLDNLLEVFLRKPDGVSSFR